VVSKPVREATGPTSSIRSEEIDVVLPLDGDQYRELLPAKKFDTLPSGEWIENRSEDGDDQKCCSIWSKITRGDPISHEEFTFFRNVNKFSV
jgi:hypothetical protein